MKVQPGLLIRLLLLPVYTYNVIMKEYWFKFYFADYISSGYSSYCHKYRKYRDRVERMEKKYLK
jgi:hypothetical protein